MEEYSIDPIGQPVGQPGHLPNPQGIAIIGGTIFVANFNAHCIKCSQLLIDSIYVHLVQNIWTLHVVSVQIEMEGCWLLIGTENESKDLYRTVNSGNSSRHTIDCDGRQSYDVAVDPRNKDIHVAFYNQSYIAIYSENGNPISPNPTYNLGGRLQYPKAICIDSRGIRYIGASW